MGVGLQKRYASQFITRRDYRLKYPIKELLCLAIYFHESKLENQTRLNVAATHAEIREKVSLHFIRTDGAQDQGWNNNHQVILRNLP